MHAIILWFDELPCASLGCYGNEAADTPGFDRLASTGCLFDWCYASPDQSGRCHSTNRSPPSAVDRLSEEGVEVCVRAVGHDASWEAVAATVHWERGNNSSCDLSLDAARQKTGPMQDRRFTLLHIQRPVGREDEDREENWLRRYDAFVGRLSDAIDGHHDRMLVIGADAGCLVDATDGDTQHVPLGDRSTHVPLIIKTGSLGAFGIRCHSLVGVEDVAATLAEWFGLRQSESRHHGETIGMSLQPVLSGASLPDRSSLILKGVDGDCGLRVPAWLCTTHWAAEASVDQQREQAIEQALLFAKPADVCEVLDLAAQSPNIVERLVDQLLRESESGSV